MNSTNIKLGIALVLMGAWGALAYFPPDGGQAADMISWIKIALGGLGVYHMKDSKGGGDA